MPTAQELDVARAVATAIFPNLDTLEGKVEFIFRLVVAILIIVLILFIFAIINMVGIFSRGLRSVQEQPRGE